MSLKFCELFHFGFSRIFHFGERAYIRILGSEPVIRWSENDHRLVGFCDMTLRDTKLCYVMSLDINHVHG
jgi:hypothetical protein